jgi:hypothetical protein
VLPGVARLPAHCRRPDRLCNAQQPAGERGDETQVKDDDQDSAQC